MKTISKYDRITGEILESYQGSDEDITLFLGGDTDFVVDGLLSSKTHYINVTTKEVIEKPSRPSEEYMWNVYEKSWEPSPDIASMTVREKRDNALRASDWITLSDVIMDPTKKEEWILYRQQLRDITNQLVPGMTSDQIIWPQRPT